MPKTKRWFVEVTMLIEAPTKGEAIEMAKQMLKLDEPNANVMCADVTDVQLDKDPFVTGLY